jgi:hypothetical protein
MKTTILSLMIGLAVPWLAHGQTNGTSVTNPVISVSPAKLNFGTIVVGQTNELSVNVQNVGGGTLTGHASSKVPFSIISGSNYVLTSQQMQTVKIRYTPKAKGSNFQAITFTAGGGASINAIGVAAELTAPTNLRLISQP